MDWRLDVAFPLLAYMPTRLPWILSGRVKRDGSALTLQVQQGLVACFQAVFPDASASDCQSWAARHLQMLANEMVDALAFHRLAQTGGPVVDLKGLDLALDLQKAGQGFILVLNHYDRLLTAPVALARHGINSSVLTMPVVDNPDLSSAQRRFLLKKINGYISVTRGEWRTTAQSLRPVHESLRRGGVWVILADAWRPEFARMREHAFLGGTLMLPTGIERLAESTGVPMIHARTISSSPTHMAVDLERLSGHPREVIDAIVRQLARDVALRPWAWWQWGQLNQMWIKAIGESN